MIRGSKSTTPVAVAESPPTVILDDEDAAAEAAAQEEIRQSVRLPMSGPRFVSFDIETGPLADEVLVSLCPEFEPPPSPGEFDPSSVKVGNIKDPAKIAEKIDAARREHAAAVAGHGAEVEAARRQHFADFKAGAALSAATGRVVAVGWSDSHGAAEIVDCDGDADAEAEGLASVWRRVEEAIRAAVPIVGWNTHGFDLPFLVRRSWILGVRPPLAIRRGRYWSELFVDLMQVWGLGSPREMLGLDAACRAFGLPGKVKEVDGVPVSGAEFYRLWRENRPVAEKYLFADLDRPACLARLMRAV